MKLTQKTKNYKDSPELTSLISENGLISVDRAGYGIFTLAPLFAVVEEAASLPLEDFIKDFKTNVYHININKSILDDSTNVASKVLFIVSKDDTERLEQYYGRAQFRIGQLSINIAIQTLVCVDLYKLSESKLVTTDKHTLKSPVPVISGQGIILNPKEGGLFELAKQKVLVDFPQYTEKPLVNPDELIN